MRFVSIKTVAQQNIQASQRIREELVGQRRTKANQIRDLVGEYGIFAQIGTQQLCKTLLCWREGTENSVTDAFRCLLKGLAEDLRHLNDRIASLDEQISQSVQQDPVVSKLITLRGVGPLTASALAGALGNGKAFQEGRAFAALRKPLKVSTHST